MMLTIYRDLGFFMLALVLYEVILAKRIIYLAEACVLLGVTVLYGASIFLTNRYTARLLERRKGAKRKEALSESSEEETGLVE
jgi:hypothetical protein